MGLTALSSLDASMPRCLAASMPRCLAASLRGRRARKERGRACAVVVPATRVVANLAFTAIRCAVAVNGRERSGGGKLATVEKWCAEALAPLSQST